VTEGQELSWSPPSSRWLLPRQQTVTRSRLRFTGGLLTWEPVGLSRKEPGSQPFRLKVGKRPGEVQELVWVHGTVAVVRSTMDAGALALCCSDPAAPAGRRVLAFLPQALISLPSGWIPVPDEARARARGQAVADGLGVPFTEHEVDLGENPNRLFPGVMRFGRMAKGVAWTASLTYLVSGPVFSAEGAYWVVHGQWLSLLLLGLGVAMTGVGTVILPPVAKRLRRRSGWRVV
jgi:hypothetical protein